jgi:hypothetical protein
MFCCSVGLSMFHLCTDHSREMRNVIESLLGSSLHNAVVTRSTNRLTDDLWMPMLSPMTAWKVPVLQYRKKQNSCSIPGIAWLLTSAQSHGQCLRIILLFGRDNLYLLMISLSGHLKGAAYHGISCFSED